MSWFGFVNAFMAGSLASTMSWFWFFKKFGMLEHHEKYPELKRLRRFFFIAAPFGVLLNCYLAWI